MALNPIAQPRPTALPASAPLRWPLAFLALTLAVMGASVSRAVFALALLAFCLLANGALTAALTESRKRRQPAWLLAERLVELSPSAQAQIVAVLDEIAPLAQIEVPA